MVGGRIRALFYQLIMVRVLEFDMLVHGSFRAILLAATLAIVLPLDFISIPSVLLLLPFGGFPPDVIPELLFGFFVIVNDLLEYLLPLPIKLLHLPLNLLAVHFYVHNLLEALLVVVGGRAVGRGLNRRGRELYERGRLLVLGLELFCCGGDIREV